MALTGRRIRQIIREEAQRALSEESPRMLGKGGGFNLGGGGGDDDGGGGGGWEPEPGGRDESQRFAFYGGYDDSGLIYLYSGDESLDETWASWATLTRDLYEKHGGEVYWSSVDFDPKKVTVIESMVEFIKSDLAESFGSGGKQNPGVK